MKFATITAGPARPAVRRVEVMALDRSMRSYDEDGRLRVRATNISKAAVNPYLGRTIPDCDRLGLDPDRVYMLFRDPGELARAAATFNNVPLLDRHAAACAADHKPDLVVGSTGSDCQFVPPYLQVSLVVWAGDSIGRINDGTQRQLSAAYRYRASPEAGVYQGVRYDLRMADIRGSHVALVEEGRAGPDVLIGDEALKPKGKFKMARDDDTPGIDKDTRAALMDYLAEYLGPAELEAVTQILAGEAITAPAMAGDAAGGRAAGRAQGEEAYLRRFPGADRLR